MGQTQQEAFQKLKEEHCDLIIEHRKLKKEMESIKEGSPCDLCDFPDLSHFRVEKRNSDGSVESRPLKIGHIGLFLTNDFRFPRVWGLKSELTEQGWRVV